MDRYYAAIDEQSNLIGFFTFTRCGDAVEVGLGLRPDLTGGGLGLNYVEAGLTFGRSLFGPTNFKLKVAAFNRRAIRVYERAGFRPVRTFMQSTNGGEYEFLEMVRKA
jgi:ribosomal-protein-alanine N-acetyltransferase